LTINTTFNPGTEFRNILIIESRASWPAFDALFDPSQDLVLTYDFALRKQIEERGGTAFYVDRLVEPSVMQENNFLMYEFFRDWHFDAQGKDIFRSRDVDFGFSFRIEIWNDFTFYIRSRLCLEQLRLLKWQTLYLDARLALLRDALDDMEITFTIPAPVSDTAAALPKYFFPIHRWMHERLRARLPRHVVRDLVVTVQGLMMSWLDSLSANTRRKAGVFVQEYHPTRKLLQCLLDHSGVRVVQAHFSSAPGLKKLFRERPIPVYGSINRHQAEADRLAANFRQDRAARLVLSNGVDVTEAAYRTIEGRIIEILPQSLRDLHCVIQYLDRHPLSLEILIGNVGQLAMLVDSVAKSGGVPSFLIINGLLGNAFMDEAKYATIINGYSMSIRDNYFRSMGNIVCLGDPRMDAYANVPAKSINRTIPTITIGTSGFNNVDLNSYLAVEFEFLQEVLSAVRNICTGGQKCRVILKVRPNGYRGQYERFVEEYFPDLVELILDNTPMQAVLDQSDLFISIYSQTLFEASCLGIPVIYHKTDREIMDPPFDGNSELVTTHNVPDLEQALRDFLAADDRFNDFQEKTVMEKYIGPLDGGNLERNLSFVLDLLKKNEGRM